MVKSNILYISLLVLIASGCGTVPKESHASYDEQLPKELFTLKGGAPVFSDEFEYAYSKNNFNNKKANTKTDIEEYLDLYIIFKQKVQVAKDLGMDTTVAFRNEFEGYKESLANSYIQSKDLTEKLIQEAYDRYTEEVSASHILIRLENEEDTLAAYQKIDSIHQLALQGQDFTELAKQFSEDPSAKNNGGDLGYFTSMRMVYPFESAAYNTSVGSISDIVRTRFGYHVLKVKDRRPSQGKVSVSHIMIRSVANDNEEKKQVAKDKVFEIHDQLNNGVEWEQLCKQFSEDFNTRNKGGKLPPFGSGQMPGDFAQAAFDLQEVGQYSDPITTPYGWHIIKLEGKQPIETYEQMKPRIKNHISRDERVALNKKAIVNKLKAENNFVKIANHKLLSRTDSTLLKGSWKYRGQPQDTAAIFTIGSERYSAEDFYNYILTKQKSVRNRGVNTYTNLLYDQFEEKALKDYEKDHLAEKNVEYKMLIREYWEGILLFNLMSEKVWDKASEDTLGLSSFFEKNRSKYQWKERAQATIYSAETPQTIDEIVELYESNDTTSLSEEALTKKYNTKSKLALEVDEDLYEQKDNEVMTKVEWKTGRFRTDHNGRYYLIIIDEVIPAQSKELNECKGLVIADYQEELESKWVKELNAEYPATINKATFARTLKKLEK